MKCSLIRSSENLAGRLPQRSLTSQFLKKSATKTNSNTCYALRNKKIRLENDCIPFEVLFNPVLGEPRGEVAHPEVSSFADHGGRERQPRWPRLYSSRPLFFRGCGINFGFEIHATGKMAPVWPVNITRSCLWPLI